MTNRTQDMKRFIASIDHNHGPSVATQIIREFPLDEFSSSSGRETFLDRAIEIEVDRKFKETREKKAARKESRIPNQDEAATRIAFKLSDEPMGKLFAKVEMLAEVLSFLHAVSRRKLAAGCRSRAKRWQKLATRFENEFAAAPGCSGIDGTPNSSLCCDCNPDVKCYLQPKAPESTDD